MKRINVFWYLLIFILLTTGGIPMKAQSTGDFEKASKYLVEDGVLTMAEINSMVEEKDQESVITYAREHGWCPGAKDEKKTDFEVDPESVVAIDINILTTPPTAGEIEAVWESFSKEFSADRFAFKGDAIDLGEGVDGYNFSHYSEGLKIFGYLYRPRAAGIYPLIIMNHGGFGIGPMQIPELTEENDGKKVGWPFSMWCIELARKGYVVMASSYRGTRTDAGLSGGNFEGAKGEVSDVLNMLQCAKILPFVDSARIGMTGTSHGGWITALAIQRTDEIKAAVSFFPPGDIYFSENGPWGGAGPRAESIMEGKFLGGGAVTILDRAVLLPLVQGKATMEETRAEMIARTVRLFAKHTQAPVYFISGGNDSLTPDVEVLYETIKELGKETWFKNYPGEGHGFTYRGSPGAIEGSFYETVEFFGRMLKSAKD